TDTAYNLLLSMKSKDEDVSAAIIRLLKKKASLAECAGLWIDIPNEEIEEMEEGMKELRKSFSRSLKERSGMK
ncbi:MAG: hypothetical protein IMF19_10265, partial [Proteobacteria bacterium]|nr:hypothetical protein [Pseudomonadota bacterium]